MNDGDSASIETDLLLLEAQSRQRWHDNWNFRAYLKQHVDPATIDASAQRLNAKVTARIDCTDCANCCRQSTPYLTDDDITCAAKAMGIADIEFKQRYLDQDQSGEYLFRSRPCPMLQNSLCGIYPNRPSNCRSYPHLDLPNFLGNSIAAIENYRVCPIVYNVYEQLKSSFPYDPAVDYIGEVEQEIGLSSNRDNGG